MKRLSISYIIAYIIISAVFFFEKISKFIYKTKLEKITEIEEKEDALLLKNNHRLLFIFKKNGRHDIFFSKGIISFQYFGCALRNDYHEFKISPKSEERLKKV